MFTAVRVWPDAHYGAYIISRFLSYLYRADPRSSAVYNVCPKPLVCWNCGFESRSRHGYSYVVFVYCARPIVEEPR
jgi:hypothetical protein